MTIVSLGSVLNAFAGALDVFADATHGVAGGERGGNGKTNNGEKNAFHG